MSGAAEPTAEHEEKLERVARLAQAAGADGVLLAAHHNIAWLTSGRHNRVDNSREAGTSRLLIAADGRRFVLANAIEMPRMLGEVLAGLDYTPIEYAWVDDQELSSLLYLQVILKNGIDPALAEKEMDSVVNNILQNGVSNDELERARNRYLADFSRRMERTGGMGGIAPTRGISGEHLYRARARPKPVGHLLAQRQ